MTDDRRRFVFWHDGSEHRLHQACLIMQLVLHDDTAFNSGAIFQVLLVSKSMAACDQDNARQVPFTFQQFSRLNA